ncbi:MAG: hypothetical protein N4A46_03910 [Schleiferiaceae bacterium]|nr:hypothetical protein [Schleiferiaceae bacterium]
MLINKRVQNWTLVLMLICGFSCKKENTSFPVVEVIQPIANSHFTVGDTLLVEAKASDDNLRRVEVTVVDENFLPVQTSSSVTPVTNPMHFTRWFEISNLDLTSGVYHIRVRAYNDENYASGFQQIQVAGIPKVRQGWYIARENTNGIAVEYYPEQGNGKLVYTSAGDLLGFEIWNGEQRVKTLPRNEGIEGLIDNDQNNLIHSVSHAVNPGGSPHFTGIGLVNEGFAIMSYQGAVQILGANNETKRTLLLPIGWSGEHIVETNSSWMVFAQKPGIGKKVFRFSSSTGILLSEIPVADQEIIYTKNYNGSALVVTKNERVYGLTEGGVVNELKAASNAVVNDAVYIDDDQLLYAKNGGLFQFDLSTKQEIKIEAVPYVPEVLSYDEVNEEVQLSKGQLFEVRVKNGWSVKKSLNLAQQILEHGAVFNR